MPSKVTTLGKSFLTEWALKRPQTGVFSEVVTQVAALLEHTSAMRITALEVKFDSLCLGVLDSDGLVPLFGYALECLVLRSS